MAAADTDGVPTGWEGILDPGERIIWQGRPSGRLTFRGQKPGAMLVGGVFVAVSLFFIAIGFAVGSVIFVLFPMIHLSVGLALVAGQPFWRVYAHRHTWYTLTDRRAVIATDHWPTRRKLGTWRIGSDSPVARIDGPIPGVQFAFENLTGQRGPYQRPILFEMIDDADAVIAILNQIRQRTA
jgi:hypothetical protein